MTAHSLYSEATDYLDFGEGTKVRIKNTTVTLKGIFRREDNSRWQSLVNTEGHYKNVDFHLDWVGATKSPLTSDIQQYGYVCSRVRDMKRKFIELENETARVRQAKDNESREKSNVIRELAQLKSQVVDVAKRNFFDVINAVKG